ncbi:MAG: M23 family metallopeptidase [Fervidobacterium sp.]
MSFMGFTSFTRKLSSTFFILIIALSVAVFSLYIPPVDNSYITATFLEFRATGNIPHFHSGVDFSTFLKEGVPVKAVENGYLVRLEIDKGGIYGMTVVLEHQDGNRTLYAHLSKFSEKVDNILSMLSAEFGEQRIVVEFSSDDIKFSKGEIIGYSGKTGEASIAHAHFEVRNKDEKVVYNPLQFIDKSLLRPVEMKVLLKSIIIDDTEYPFSNGATYNFSGPYPRISVEAYTELAKNLLGVKEIKMYFSNNLVYNIKLDELPMELWEQPFEIYHSKSIMTSIAYRGFYKLFSDKSFPFIKVNELSKHSDNNYSVRLEILDDFGNIGTFYFNVQRKL